MVRKLKSKNIKEKYSHSFAEMAIEQKGNNQFLTLVNSIINWNKIDDIFSQNIVKTNLGASSYSDIFLFKIILLQTWYNLSDPAVEEQLNDRISFIKFLGISIDSPTPDHSTISKFRTYLVKNKIYDLLFQEVNRQLIENQILIKNGAIVDASVIASSRRPRKVIEIDNIQEDRAESENDVKAEIKYSDDKEATWIKKGGKFSYGYKIHNAVNTDGFYLGGHVTGANVSDMKELNKVVKECDLEKGSEVFADKGYASSENRKTLILLEMIDKIMHKAVRGKPLTKENYNENKKISKIRFVVEQSFGLIKRHMGFGRMRYIGIEKCSYENKIKMLSHNIKKGAYFVMKMLSGKNIFKTSKI